MDKANLENVMQLFVQDDPDAAAMFDTTLHEQVSEAQGCSKVLAGG